MPADNVELGTACGKLHRVSVLAITDAGMAFSLVFSQLHHAACFACFAFTTPAAAQLWLLLHGSG